MIMRKNIASIFAFALIAIILPLSAQAAFNSEDLGDAEDYKIIDSDRYDISQSVWNDLEDAYDDIRDESCDHTYSTSAMDRTYTEGVYCFSGSARISNKVTLDGNGDDDSVFIFQIDDNLTMSDDAQIRLVDDAQWENVFWTVGGYSRIGEDTKFKGTLFSDDDIRIGDGADVRGRLFSLNGVVNEDDNNFDHSCPGCNEVGSGDYYYNDGNYDSDYAYYYDYYSNYYANKFGTYNYSTRYNNYVPAPSYDDYYQNYSYYNNGYVLGASTQYYPALPNTGGGGQTGLFAMIVAAGALLFANVYKAIRRKGARA